MNGVDILAMEEVVTKWTFNMNVFLVLSIIVTVIAIAVFVHLLATEGFYSINLLGCMAIIGLGLILGFLFGTIFSTPTKYETQYKVTISDEVPLTDFLDKYEIIETEGKIYTVREKNNDK